MSRKQDRRPRFAGLKKRLGRLLAALMALALAAVFYLAVILGQPTPEAQEAQRAAGESAQPLLQAQPAYQTQSEGDMTELLGQFPAPALTLSPGGGAAFQSGRAYDLAFEGGFARLLELTYQTAQGETVVLESIYPARAFSLLGREDYRLNAMGQSVLGGQSAVRMEGPRGIRLHAQGEQALYALRAPALSDEALAALTRATTLTAPS